MSGPDPQPIAPTPAPNAPAAPLRSRAIRNCCLWLVLIPLIGLAIVQTVAVAMKTPGGWDAVQQATPAALAEATMQTVAGFALALLVHRMAPRAGLWVAIGLALVVVYLMALSGLSHGLQRSLAWIPFMLLLSIGALGAIPAALHDAAAVDRAEGWFKFRTITLPLVLPLLLAGAIFRAADAYRPGDGRVFIGAHLLLISAIVAGSALARGRG
ncbi:MAG TPA: hypothetical protein VGR35_15225 [Tepidisphaeraceae bacterium]|nr:hypothetical protein [Tepidisphaeraceae bacterium]